MDQRRQMIEDWLNGRMTITALSREYLVSRKTVYKWIRRFKTGGETGLREHSRAPLNHPNSTPNEVIEKLVLMKLRYQDWGPKKLLYQLKKEEPDVNWPAPSTIGQVLKESGLVKERRRKRKSVSCTEPFLECIRPNQVWSADFKGQFRTQDVRACYPLTITDNYSRFIITCRGLHRPTFKATKPWFEWAFRTYGLPEVIRTDNGAPFASVAVGGLSRLSIWFIKLGIRVERIEAGHPEQNGRHERMHRTLKDSTLKPPQANLEAQQEAFDKFIRYFNFVRPHEALGQRPPGTVYYSSNRPYKGENREIKYDPDTLVRKVLPNGQIKLAGIKAYLSQAMAGEVVGLTQIDYRYWKIHFNGHGLAFLDELKGQIVTTPKDYKKCYLCPQSEV
jgi:transposase InsO family protein